MFLVVHHFHSISQYLYTTAIEATINLNDLKKMPEKPIYIFVSQMTNSCIRVIVLSSYELNVLFPCEQ